MTRWKSRACPRCSGDLFVERDYDGWYEQCLQCSFKVELKPVASKVPIQLPVKLKGRPRKNSPKEVIEV